jgi:hypothetical protein
VACVTLMQGEWPPQGAQLTCCDLLLRAHLTLAQATFSHALSRCDVSTALFTLSSHSCTALSALRLSSLLPWLAPPLLGLPTDPSPLTNARCALQRTQRRTQPLHSSRRQRLRLRARQRAQPVGFGFSLQLACSCSTEPCPGASAAPSSSCSSTAASGPAARLSSPPGCNCRLP